VLESLKLPVDHEYMSFADATIAGKDITVCRTGYTGERGYELVVPADDAVEVWDAVIAAGEPFGIRACGLGARDTLRTEMGYPLHGHELSAEISPVMARAGWAVGWNKPAFWGKDALQRQRDEKTVRTLRGLIAQGRGIPRPGMTVNDEAGTELGEITSGTFSPTLRQGIGLALLERSVADGATVVIDVRGRSELFTVTKPPFVEPSTKES
jgi:aminomethyltransferase